jgi:hypothetical protein
MAKQKQTDSVKKKDSAAVAPKKAKSISGEVWSKSKKKRMRQRKSKQKMWDSQDKDDINNQSNKKGSVDRMKTVESVKQQPSSNRSAATKTSELQKSFMARLTGSRFRELNEVRTIRV